MRIQSMVVKSEDKRLVYGEVYSPMQVDTQGEAMTAEEIEAMAHHFLAKGRTENIDVSHDEQRSGVVVVESFIARKNDPDNFVEGSWVLGAKILPDDLWDLVKKGELNGFSFSGVVTKEPVRAVVTVTKRLEGETEFSTVGLLPKHTHQIYLSFDGKGKVIESETGLAFGHVHDVFRTTATESNMDHSHRLVLVDNADRG